MWADDNVVSSDADIEGTSDDELIVEVEGEEYTVGIDPELSADSVDDIAVVEHADGSAQGFIDTDGDGRADEYVVWDPQEGETTRAAYDEASGEWVSMSSEMDASFEDAVTDTSTGDVITADLPQGNIEVGPATVDTNDDGVNDTAIVEDDTGGTIIFTDVDGDGQADVAVTIDQEGNSVEYEHTGDGEWSVAASVSESTFVEPASDSLWGGGGHDIVEGVAKIDSMTGQWISQN